LSHADSSGVMSERRLGANTEQAFRRDYELSAETAPHLNDKGNGDQIVQVQVQVQVPRRLSRSQRELVTKLGESLSGDNKLRSPGLLDKMKDLFN
jgi:DnaJ-class molecular chaperone